ncbi:MAG TPA: tetratricopeptide repeat protein [Candidatus Tectomicrobia bacterium]
MRALHQLGVVYAHAGLPDAVQAETHYQQALALAEKLGMRPLVAHCHLGPGTQYATTGQRQQVRTELSTAVQMYCTMAMTLWLPRWMPRPAKVSVAVLAIAAHTVYCSRRIWRFNVPGQVWYDPLIFHESRRSR